MYKVNKLLPKEDAIEFGKIQQSFIKNYIDCKEKMDIDSWLEKMLEDNLPDNSKSEAKQISKEIIETLKLNEENKKSLQYSINSGKSKEVWFARKVQDATSHLSMSEVVNYLHELDSALNQANSSMLDTITTNKGIISMNKNLDGFIAEQFHANTFNLDAASKGKNILAEVVVPKDGQVYGKNSVDIVLKDSTGKIVQRYQAKYGKNATSTIRMIKDGNYNNQRLLVPEEQVKAVQEAFPNKTVTATIEYGNIKSKGLDKITAKELQNEAQSGNWNNQNWNAYKTKDLAMGIGKQAGFAALQGAAIGVGFDIASKVWNGDEVNAEEVVEVALISGADFGIKAATAGALKVGAEKGIISIIPKGTPAGTLANIAYVAIENVKVIGKITNGELTIREGLEKMEQTTVATVAGLVAMTKGAAIGGTIGIVFGPVGAVVGSFVGGTLAYMAGSKVGETVVKAAQKVREKSKEIVKDIGNKASEGLGFVGNGIKNVGRSFLSVLGF